MEKTFQEIEEIIIKSRNASLIAYEQAIREGLTPEEARKIIPYLSNQNIRDIIHEAGFPKID